MSQRSDGPWECTPSATPDYAPEFTVYAGTGERVAIVFQSFANVALITSAPEMLTALQLAEDTFGSLDPADPTAAQVAIDAIRSAISMATEF